MNIAELLKDDDDNEEEKPIGGAGVWPHSLEVHPLLPGRSRRCGFWISAVAPYGVSYVIDTAQLAGSPVPLVGSIPEDTLLVVIHPTDAQHIRKAMASYAAAPHPAFLAARIIDSQCRQDPTLAGRMRWKI